MIAKNEERLLRHPPIIAALYLNPKTRMSTAQRALELAVRNNVRVEGIPAFDEAARAIQQSGAPDPAQLAKEDAAFARAAEVAVDQSAALQLIAVDEKEAAALAEAEAQAAEQAVESTDVVEEEKKQKISELSPAGKIRLATLGNAFARAVLIRDTNRQVSMAAIRSPAVTDMEVHALRVEPRPRRRHRALHRQPAAVGAAVRHQGGAVQQPEVPAAGGDALFAAPERARSEGAVALEGHPVGAVRRRPSRCCRSGTHEDAARELRRAHRRRPGGAAARPSRGSAPARRAPSDVAWLLVLRLVAGELDALVRAVGIGARVRRRRGGAGDPGDVARRAARHRRHPRRRRGHAAVVARRKRAFDVAAYAWIPYLAVQLAGALVVHGAAARRRRPQAHGVIERRGLTWALAVWIVALVELRKLPAEEARA